MITADFICARPGENSMAVSSSGLSIDMTVAINGSSDLSGIIQFNDEGCVYSISLEETWSFIYDYEIKVDGRGPEGISGGRGFLYFTDATGDVYELKLYRSGRHVHVLDFNSRDPTITTITWSNHRR